MIKDIEALILQYLEEEKKWAEAGKPYRSEERIAQIHQVCQDCPFFKKSGGYIPGYDKCEVCGCQLHASSKLLNKIAWATTECPDKPPKWLAEPI